MGVNFSKIPFKRAIDGAKHENRIDVNNASTSSIFTLTVDCFDEIFDYLTLEDLCSFGQTCRKSQQIAGNYFKSNYSNATTYSTSHTVCTVHWHDNGWVKGQSDATMCFMPFITYLVIGSLGEVISVYTDETQPLPYIRSHLTELISLNHISFVGFYLTKDDIDSIRPLLNQIEILTLRQCTIRIDMYKGLLRFCQNLKQLNVYDHVGWFGKTKHEHSWLLHKYPKLEYFKLISDWPPYEIGDLSTFFRKNPKIRNFSTNSRCLLERKNDLIKFMPCLNDLTIRAINVDYETNLDSIMGLLTVFGERNRYERLHISINSLNRQTSKHLNCLKNLESLNIRALNKIHGLLQLKNLKELSILNIDDKTDTEILANDLPSLERLIIFNTNIETIFPFIRRSPKLNKIKIALLDESTFKREHFKIRLMNNERGNLMGARKLTIFVPNSTFFTMKWATTNGDLNLNFIEIRRSDSQFLDFEFMNR